MLGFLLILKRNRFLLLFNIIQAKILYSTSVALDKVNVALHVRLVAYMVVFYVSKLLFYKVLFLLFALV